jgi:mono/diheme cytochrome c family protein
LHSAGRMHVSHRLKLISVLGGSLLACAGIAANGCSANSTQNSGSEDGGGDASAVKPGADAAVETGADGSAVGPNLDGGPDTGVNAQTDGGDAALPGTSGPDSGAEAITQVSGTDTTDGKQVFRFETFGNEGYWTRVLELPQGMAAASVTPAQALALGLSVDIDSVPAPLAALIAAQLADAGAGADPTTIPALQNPANTAALIEANAVVGVVARNVTTLNGTLDIDDSDVFAGESVGISCAICHGITDGSVLSLPKGGSIGHRLDGPSNNNIQIGKIIALATHSAAFYPTLGLTLASAPGKTVARTGLASSLIPLPQGMTSAAFEAAVDTYLNDDTLYPVGMFDDQPDGNGAPMHIQPFFRQDLAAPYGSDGSIHQLQNFSNAVYTALLDGTDLLASAPASNDPTDAGAAAAAFSGPQYLEYEKGGAAGLEIIANYKYIIETMLGIPPYATTPAADGGVVGNNGYPYVGRFGGCAAAPAGVENEPSIGGLKCDQTKLLDMNAYLFTLHAPAGVKGDPGVTAAGRNVFRQQCTSCHNDDQSLAVPQDIVAFNDTVDLYANAPSRPDLFPGWAGVLVANRPGPPFAALVPAKNSVGIFDDKMILTEASNYGQPRGDALPLLMDLARKRSFLHDDEVIAASGSPTDSLSLLIDPSRGATAPHPFYVTDTSQRAAVVTYLQSLDDTPLN